MLSANPAHDLIQLDQLRNDPLFSEVDGETGTGADQISVVVIDTGLDGSHRDLVGNFVAYVDFVDDEFNADGSRIVHTDPSLSEDEDGHGTHVAGTIGATNSGLGTAPGVNLIGLRVLGQNQRNADVAEALQWVLDNQATHRIVAVNMSMGWTVYLQSPDQVAGSPLFMQLDSLIRKLEDAGVTVVSAAGNDYFDHASDAKPLNPLRENVIAPAISSTIAGGAVWKDGSRSNVSWFGPVDKTTGADRLVSFSQRLSTLDAMLFAPGAMIRSTVPGNRYELSAGTSMATPGITGVVALMQDASLQFGNRLLTPREVRDILNTTADSITDGDDEDDNVRNGNNTYRRVNAYRAVQEVRRRVAETPPEGTPPLPPEPEPPAGSERDKNGTMLTAQKITSLPEDLISAYRGDTFIGDDSGYGFTTMVADVDMFEVKATSSGRLLVQASQSSSNLSPVIRVFDSTGQEIAISGNTSPQPTTRISHQVSPGTYYIGISGFGNDSYSPERRGTGVKGQTGNYSLGVALRTQIPVDLDGVIGGSGVPEFKLADYADLGFIHEPGADTTQQVTARWMRAHVGDDSTTSPGGWDVDMLRIVADRPTEIKIETSRTNGDGTSIRFETDTILRLFDSEGMQLAINDNLAFNSVSSRITARIEPGVYYVGVSGAFYRSKQYDPIDLSNRSSGGTTGTGGYFISVTFPIIKPTDPTGTFPGATPVSVPLGGTRTITDWIGRDGLTDVTGTGDVDLYRIKPATDGTLLVDINTKYGPGFDGTSSFVDTRLRIWQDSIVNGVPVWTELTPASDNDVATDFIGDPTELVSSNLTNDRFGRPTGHAKDSFKRISVLRDTTYLIGVSQAANSGYVLDNFNTRTGAETVDLKYDLVLKLGGTAGFTDTNGSLSPGRLTAIDLTSASAQRTGEIGREGTTSVGNTDVDFYRVRFNGTTGTTPSRLLNLDLDRTTSTFDGFLALFDSTGKLLASNNDEAPGSLDPVLNVPIQVNTDYYVAVTGSGNERFNPFVIGSGGGGSIGSYTLKMSAAIPGTVPRGRLTETLAASKSPRALDLDRQLQGLDLTAANVFTANSLKPITVGSSAVRVGGAIGRDADSGTTTGDFNAFAGTFRTASGLASSSAVVFDQIGGTDVDLIPVEITADNWYDIRSLRPGGLSGDLPANTRLRLYRQDGTPVSPASAASGDGGQIDDQLIFQLTAGRYFLTVLADGDGASKYDFSQQNFSGSFTADEIRQMKLNSGVYEVSIQPLSVGITSVERLRSGAVVIHLDNLLDEARLTLYSQQGTNTVSPTLKVTDPQGRTVPGSLVFDAVERKITFVPTNPALSAGDYKLQLRRQDLATPVGDITAGSDVYTLDFKVPAQSRYLSVPGVVRNAGQTVEIGGTGRGLPIKVSDAANLVDITLRLQYSEDLLTVSAATLAPGMPAGWAVQSFRKLPGQIEVRLKGSTPLPAGERELVRLTASVPSTAPYDSSTILSIDGGARDKDGLPVDFGERTAIQKIRNFADLNANGVIDIADARVAYQQFQYQNTGNPLAGFNKTDLLDPNLIADVNLNGEIDIADARILYLKFLGTDNGRIPSPQFVPAGEWPDPTFQVSSGEGVLGDRITVSISVSAWEPAAVNEAITSISLPEISYDTQRLNLVSSDVKVSTSLTGWGNPFDFDPQVDDAAGTVKWGIFAANNDKAIRYAQLPEVLTLTFSIAANAEPGDATISLKRLDAYNLNNDPLTVSLVSGKITVTAPPNDPPVANPDGGSGIAGFITSEDASFTFTTLSILSNDSDPNSDTFSIDSFTPPNKGVLTKNGDVFTFDPAGQFEGLQAGQSELVTFTYVLRDSKGAMSAPATVTMTVNGVNDRPVAVADPGPGITLGFSGSEDAAFTTASVLANDSDVDSASFTVREFNPPAKGVVTLNANGTFLFDPNGQFESLSAGQSETVKFSYRIADASDLAADNFVDVTLTINGVNDAPGITGPGNRTTNEDTPLTGLLVTLSDVDSENLTLTATSSNQTLVPNQNIEVSGSGAQRTLRITPAANQFGQVDITLRCFDGLVETAQTFTVTVTAVNDPPEISAIANQQTVRNLSISGLVFTVTDVDQQPLTVSVASDNPTLLPPSGLQLTGSGNSRTLSITPATEQIGTARVTLSVTDGITTTTRSFDVTVNAVNRPPVISEIPARQTDEDQPLTVLVTVSDPDNDGLTVTAVSSDQLLLPASRVVLSGSGNERTLTLTPADNRFGTASITVTVSDGALSASRTFAVTVNSVNDAPTAAADSISTPKGKAAVISVLANDGDSDGTLNAGSVEITGAAANGSLEIAPTGVVTYTPATGFTGADTFRYRVRDNGGLLSNEAVVSVTVLANAPPVIPALQSQQLAVGGSALSLPLNITDADGDPLTISAAADNASLFSTLTVSGTPGNRVLQLAPGTRPGVGRVTVTASDGINPAVSASFDVSLSLFVDAGSSRPVAGAVSHVGYATGGAAFSTGAAISGIPEGIPQDLFRTQLYGSSTSTPLSFTMPTIAGQSYAVDLLFAEIWSGAFAAGKRVFDVRLEDKLVIDDLDVFARVGGNKAFVQSFEVVGDGQLTLDLPRSVQSPIISGIRIRPAGPANVAPAISEVANQQTQEDQSIAQVGFTVTDPEEQPVTVTVSSSDSLLLPASGLVLSGTGTSRNLSISPAPNRFGTATVTLSASDGKASSSRTFTVTVSSVNDVPVAVADSTGTIQGTPVTIQVLANDSDPDGTLDPAGVTVTSPSAAGGTVVNANGTITFTPTATFTGSTTFSYIVRDNSGDVSAPATVTITVTPTPPPANRRPVANPDPATGTAGFTVTEDGEFITDSVLANDFDPDGHLMTVLSHTQPNKGFVNSLGDGRFLFATDGDFEQLAAGQSQTVRFNYTVVDSEGLASAAPAEVTITVTGVNDAPVAANDPGKVVRSGASLVIPVLDNDSDVDSLLNRSSVLIASQPAKGTLTVNADGTVTYLPNPGATGGDSFRYTVSDTQGLRSAEATVTLTVVTNSPPVLSAISPKKLLVNGNGAGAAFTVNDADGDPVKLSTTVAHPSVLEARGSESAVNGLNVRELEADGPAGRTTVTITANDGVNAPVSTSFEVTTEIFVNAGGPGVAGSVIGSAASLLQNPGTIRGAASFGTSAAISGAPAGVPASIFQSLLYASTSAPMQLNFPTVSGQSYEVDLFFAEIWSGAFAAGRRVFDVAFDGRVVLDNFDVFALAGGNRALTRTFDVVGDGMLTIDLIREVQNPIISGVRIRPKAESNQAPVISEIPAQQTNEDVRLADIAFTVTDPDSQPVSVSVSSSDPMLLPASGLQLSGSGSSRTLSIMPAANRFGTATVNVTATDGLATTTRSFTVTVNSVNDAPVAIGDIVTTPRNLPITIPVLVNDSDPDGTLNPATVEITAPALASAGTAVANANGTVTFTPSAGFTGDATFSYTVRDNSGLVSNAAVVSVKVQANQSPVVSTLADIELNVGSTSSSIPFTITDADGDALTVTAAAADAEIVRAVAVNGTGSERRILVTAGNSVGITTVTVTVSDGVNAPVTRSFKVLVYALIDAGTTAPVAGSVSDATFQNGVGKTFATSAAVKPVAGVSEQLFRSIVWDDVGGRELEFDIRAKAGERYAVDLYFAEIWNGAFAPGRRVFDVALDGKTVLDDFDIFREAGGGNIGIARRFELESDGIIDLDLLHGIQNPALAGIRVTPMSTAK